MPKYAWLTKEERKANDRECKARWKENNKEKRREYARRRYQNNKAYFNAKSRAYYAANKQRMNAYGVAWVRRKKEATRLAKAGRPRPPCCELCGVPCKARFDHCHASGHFRGWICGRCNWVLGAVKDSVELLEKMISYLQQSKARVA